MLHFATTCHLTVYCLYVTLCSKRCFTLPQLVTLLCIVYMSHFAVNVASLCHTCHLTVYCLYATLCSKQSFEREWEFPSTTRNKVRTSHFYRLLCDETPRKYVFDVTSVGQRSSPWTCNSVKVEMNFTASASSIFLVHNLYCDKCI